MTYKNLLIKKALESDTLKELSVSNTKEELKKLFNNCLEAFNENDDLSPENGYVITIATLISRNRLNDDNHNYSNFDEDVFHDLWKMVDDLHLNQTEMIKWIPEVFNECSYVYQYQITHKFFSKVFTGNQYQEYLKKIEPIMFSFDEWFEVITQFDSSTDAEAALIKQFSSDTNLDRFQGRIYGTEWRIEFLQEVLEYCEKNDMLSVKHHCWKIIASEAVWGMNSEWLVNQYGYDYFFGPNKILFEKEFLDEAIKALDYGRAWEIDFDFDKFTQSKNLKNFLQKRKNLRIQDILADIENKTSHEWELMYSLGDVFKKDPELIKSNDKIWKFFINLPQSILKALEDGVIKGDNWSDKVKYIESFDCWKDAAPEFKKFHAEKSSEEQLLSKLLDYLSDADARYSGMIDRLEEIGFDNFNTKTHEEFRDHFVNGSWKNTCEPFDVYFPSEYSDEDGFYNDKEEWISFGEWCGANEL